MPDYFPDDIETKDLQGNIDDIEEEEPKNPYFYLPHDAVDVLLGCNANAGLICAYIVAAKSRQSNSNFLTAGWNSVSKCLGIRPQKAKRIYLELSELVYGGNKLVKSFLSHRTKDCIKLKDIGHQSSAIYLEYNYVGHNSKYVKFPIKKLYDLGDIASRVLLYIYRNISIWMRGYQVSVDAETELLAINNEVGIFSGKAPIVELPYPKLCKFAESAENDVDRRVRLKVDDAVNSLISAKLLKSVVVACVYRDNHQTSYYDIHTKGEPLKCSIREKIRKAAEDLGVSQGRKDGKSHDRVYHVIAPVGHTVRLRRVLRPAHLHLPEFHSMIRDAERRREGHHIKLRLWLDALEGKQDIKATKSSTPTPCKMDFEPDDDVPF
jgi:hypothetical protein